MPEILTESFCERCGTRYTFESSAPRKTRRLGQFKTLSKGLKNYVLSDDTSMDEAMAAARSDEERETTAQQLDAFHSTFNFCMNCRQYTCSNCWNQAEGRCLTCSPNLGRDILEAPFPSSAPFEPQPISAEAWPTTDLPPVELVVPSLSVNGANGIAAESVADEPSNGVVPPEVAEEDDPGAHFSFLTPTATEPEAPVAEPEAPVAAAPVEAAPAWPEPVPQAEAEAQPSAEFTDAVEAATAEVAAIEASIDEAAEAVAAARVESTPELPATLDERASALASHTTDLIARFRPGQNIDAELAAFEAGIEANEALAPDAQPVAADAVEGELAADAGLPVAEPSLPTEWPEPDPELVAAAWPEPEADATVLAAQSEPEWPAEPAPIVAEPVHEPAAAVAPEPEPIAAEPIAAEPEPEPVAAEAPAVEPEPAAPPIAASAEPVRTDRIEQPTWRIYAPEQGTPPVGQPLEAPLAPPASPAAPVPPAASAEPQWPARPDIQDSPSMALLANRNRSSSDALWAASAQEVLAPVSGPAVAATSVQPCSSCGLSLSATARFCRRCGTRQG